MAGQYCERLRASLWPHAGASGKYQGFAQQRELGDCEDCVSEVDDNMIHFELGKNKSRSQDGHLTAALSLTGCSIHLATKGSRRARGGQFAGGYAALVQHGGPRGAPVQTKGIGT